MEYYVLALQLHIVLLSEEVRLCSLELWQLMVLGSAQVWAVERRWESYLGSNLGVDHREIRIDPVLGYFESLYLEPCPLQMLHLVEPCYPNAETAVVDLVEELMLCGWGIRVLEDGL